MNPLSYTVAGGQLQPASVGMARTTEAGIGKLTGFSVSLVTQASRYVANVYSYLGSQFPTLSNYMGREIMGRSVSSTLGYGIAFANPALNIASSLKTLASCAFESGSVARESRQIMDEASHQQDGNTQATYQAAVGLINLTENKVAAHREAASFLVQSPLAIGVRTALTITAPVLAAPVIGAPLATAAIGAGLVAQIGSHFANALIHRFTASAEEESIKDVKTIKRLLEKFQESRELFEVTLQGVTGQRNRFAQEAQALQTELDSATQEQARLRQEIVELSDNYAEFIQNSDSSLDLSNNAGQIKTLEEELSRAQDQIEQLNADHQQATAAQAELQEELEKAIAEREGIQQLLNQKETAHAEIQQQLTQEQTARPESQQRLDQEQTAHADTQRDLEQKTAEMVTVQQALEQEKTDRDQAEKALTEAQQSLQNARQNRSDESRITTLEESLARINADLQTKETDLIEANNKVTDLEEALEAKDSKIEKLKAMLRTFSDAEGENLGDYTKKIQSSVTKKP